MEIRLPTFSLTGWSALFDQFPVPVYTCDADGLITFYNRQAVEIWGRSPRLHDPIDRYCGSYRLYASDGTPIDHDRCWMALALATGQEHLGREILLERPDGQRITALAHAIPLRNPAGKLAGGVNVLLEIHSSKREAERLAACEARYRAIVETGLEGIWILDSEGKTTFVNRRMAELLDRSTEELLGRRLVDFVIDMAPTPGHTETIQGGARGRQVHEVQLIRQDGSCVDALFCSTRFEPSPQELPGSLHMVMDVTPWKTTQRILEIREDQLRRTEARSHVGVWEANLATSGVYWSEEVYRILGVSPKSYDPSTADITNFLHPLDTTTVLEAIESALRLRKPFQFDCRIIRPDGRERIVHAQGDPNFDSHGTLVQLHGSFHDLTDQHSAREPLEQPLEGIMPHQGQDFFDVLADHLCRICNVEFAFLGRLEPEDPPRIQTVSVSRRGRRGENFTFDLGGTPCEHVVGKSMYEVPRGVRQTFPRDRRLADMEIESYLGIPLFASTGEPLGLVALMHDQPMLHPDPNKTILELVAARASAELERNRAQVRLRDNEDRFRALVENAFEGTNIITTTGVILYSSPVNAQLLGFQPEEIAGRDCFSFVHPEDLPDLKGSMADLVANPERGIDVACRLEHKDGTWRRIEGRARNLLTHPAVQGIVITWRDVTERERANEDRRRLEEQVRHVQKLESLGILAGGIAHDFNNLLTSILGYSSLASLTLPEEAEAQEMLRQVEIAAQRAAELTEQMLTFSGHGTHTFEALRLDLLVEEMWQLLQPEIAIRAQVRLELSPAPLEGDCTQIRQIVMNLLTNASEALEGRVGTILVRTGVRPMDAEALRCSHLQEGMTAGPYAYLEVLDNGCGMDEETLGKIFDPFFTTKFTGRGLGLAAVLGIVRGHRGSVQVTSSPDKGTTFQIYLPARSDPVETATGPRPLRMPPVGCGTLLVVEDEEPIRRLIRKLMEGSGFLMLEAGDGEAGLDLFLERAEEIRLVILDLTMPGMDGWELAAHLQELRPKLPILLMSGFHHEEIATRIATLNIAGFLQKPFSPQELSRQVATILGRAEGASKTKS